jgi:hypothetical protein
MGKVKQKELEGKENYKSNPTFMHSYTVTV